MNKGKIIVLNGVSSSGKTTLAKEIQDAFDEPYMRLSIDDFINMMPSKMIKTDLGNTVYKCQTIMLQTITMLSDAGINVVVDNIMLTYFQTLKQYISELYDYPVLFVKVDCPPHELRRREADRGDRAIGQGDSQIDDLEPKTMYDITVNTFINTISECVKLIEKKLDAVDQLPVIKQLWQASKT